MSTSAKAIPPLCAGVHVAPPRGRGRRGGGPAAGGGGRGGPGGGGARPTAVAAAREILRRGRAMDKAIKTAKQLIDAKKRRGVISVTPDSTVLAALKLLAENDIGALAVIEEERL